MGAPNVVALDCSKGITRASDSEVIIYFEGVLIEKNVAICAKAQNVFQSIRTAVWLPQRTDMTALGVCSRGCIQAFTTDLTSGVVESLDFVADRRASDNSGSCDLNPARGAVPLRLRGRFPEKSFISSCAEKRLRSKSIKSVTVDHKTVLAFLFPVRIDPVEAVIPVTFARETLIYSRSRSRGNFGIVGHGASRGIF